MNGLIAEEKIQLIRERVDIVEVVSSYLPLKRSGVNHLGLCPFHGEKTPSFNVNATRQIFHCFGCGVGGNAFSFLMRMEGLSFPEAVRRLGERVGIEVEEQDQSPAEIQRRHEVEQLRHINELACSYYQRQLLEEPAGAGARRYLKERGYDGETARQFRLGFAPDQRDGLSNYLAEQGVGSAQAVQLGLIRPEKDGRGHYDLFRRRLLFPILDSRGHVAAFGGRVLDNALPKYINSAESPVYHKGSTLYGLYQAREEMRKNGDAIVVEGYFDQMALHRAGFGNAVATCGTALTGEHAKLLKRYAERVLLLFDEDGAGRKATLRAMDVLLAEGVPAAVVALPAGDDPDSFIQGRGAEAFGQCLAAARPVLEVFMDDTLARHGEAVEGRARAVEEIAAKLRLLPSEIERSLYLKALAARTGLEETLLRGRAQPEPRAAAMSSSPPSRPAPRPAAAARPRSPHRGEGVAIRAQDMLLQMLAGDMRIRRSVAAEGLEALFSDPDRRVLAAAILAQAGEEAETVDLVPVFDRLEDQQKTILSGILIRDSKIIGEEAELIFNDCRQVSARERLKRRSGELQHLLRQAETAGDLASQTSYLRELSDIKKRL